MLHALVSPHIFFCSINGPKFNIKVGTIQLLPQFLCLESENPYLLMKEFEEVCGSLQKNSETALLKLFPFSLKDKAKQWLNSLKAQSIPSWQVLQTEFFKKFFPVHRTNALRRQIMNFNVKEGETFYQCWKSFNDLLQACPHHHAFESWILVGFFYNALSSAIH